MFEKTGKNIDDWIVLVKSENFSKHGEIVKYVKSGYSLNNLNEYVTKIENNGKKVGADLI